MQGFNALAVLLCCHLGLKGLVGFKSLILSAYQECVRVTVDPRMSSACELLTKQDNEYIVEWDIPVTNIL